MAGDPLSESGVLLVDKPADWTSHDVVNCVRRRYRFKKVGHCGTLDPMATGLLVIVVGKATKLASLYSGQEKFYEGTMKLGVETTSLDAEGEVVATADYSSVTEEQVKEVAKKYIGDIQQIPPMVSAVKKGGKALYKLAREGKVVERDPRDVTIHDLKVGDINFPEIDLSVHCSKGTYIRTLAADMGKDLGCGAHLSALRRTASGMFKVADAVTMEQIKSWEKEELLEHIITLEKLAELSK